MCMKSDKPYVAVMTSTEWKVEKDAFRMGIDLDIEYDRIHTTKAEVNVDSLTGGFTIPDKINVMRRELFLLMMTGWLPRSSQSSSLPANGGCPALSASSMIF